MNGNRIDEGRNGIRVNQKRTVTAQGRRKKKKRRGRADQSEKKNLET